MTPRKSTAAQPSTAVANPPDALPDHLLRWLDTVQRRMRSELRAESTSATTTKRSATGVQVHAGQRRVLSMFGNDGVRLTDLATRADMTKQAIGEFVEGLVEKGLAVVDKDPSDLRVRLVRRTPLGNRIVAETEAMMARVEGRLRRQVGARRYDDMLQVLREIGADSLER